MDKEANEQKVTCQICGESVHIIHTHLKKVHGENSESPCTLEEYKAQFPDAPLISETAIETKKRLIQSKKMTSISSVAKEGMQDLHTLFGLKKKENSDSINVRVLPNSAHSYLVPKIDDNYIFDLGLIKTCLMGIETNIPTYLFGHAGVGKSSVFEQICARTNRPLVRVQHTANTEESNITGQWTVKKHKDKETGQIINETVFELGPLALAMKHGWTYLADEYDRAYPSILSVYQAVLEGKALFIKEADPENRIIEPHEDFRFLATGNTNGAGDESGLYPSTVVQDASTLERFGIVEEVTYLPSRQEIAIVASQADLHIDDAKDIVSFCKKVRDQFPQSISLTAGVRVAINIGKIGLMKASFPEAVKLCFSNRLPESEREAVNQIAQRIWGESDEISEEYYG